MPERHGQIVSSCRIPYLRPAALRAVGDWLHGVCGRCTDILVKVSLKTSPPRSAFSGHGHTHATVVGFCVLLQCRPHKHTEDIDVYEIFLTTLSVTALKPLGGAMAQWRKRAGEHPRVDARDARGTNR